MTTQIEGTPTEEQVGLAVDTFKLLADPTRLRILWALLHGEHSVNNLAEHVGATPAAVSQHLAKLRLARLVRTRREGTFVFYMAENAHVRRLVGEALSHAALSRAGPIMRSRQSQRHLVPEDERGDGDDRGAALSRR